MDGIPQVGSGATDTDQWTDRVVHSAVAFPSAQGARAFFSESADRWSKCTNHRLNITINDQRQPTWQSGDQTRPTPGSPSRSRAEAAIRCGHVIGFWLWTTMWSSMSTRAAPKRADSRHHRREDRSKSAPLGRKQVDHPAEDTWQCGRGRHEPRTHRLKAAGLQQSSRQQSIAARHPVATAGRNRLVASASTQFTSNSRAAERDAQAFTGQCVDVTGRVADEQHPSCASPANPLP